MGSVLGQNLVQQGLPKTALIRKIPLRTVDGAASTVFGYLYSLDPNWCWGSILSDAGLCRKNRSLESEHGDTDTEKQPTVGLGLYLFITDPLVACQCVSRSVGRHQRPD